MDNIVNVARITQYSENVHKAINELLPQLSSSATPLTEGELVAIIQSSSSHLLMAEKGGIFYGCLTLVIFNIPTGTRAWVEDVVVEESARGNGFGRLLSESAIDLAQELGAKTVDLTSRPTRKAANVLYKKIGFEMRETNVYRYRISE